MMWVCGVPEEQADAVEQPATQNDPAGQMVFCADVEPAIQK